MRSLARYAGWLLPFALSGCIFHHKNRPVPTQTLAPAAQRPLPLDLISVDLPFTLPTRPIKPMTKLPEQDLQTRQHRHKKSSGKRPEETANTQETAGVVAIGSLSSGGSAEFRHQTEESISATDGKLKSIKRPLNDSEQKIAEHIRGFLKQARCALGSGDVEGAHTLAAKAQVLLAELTK